MTSCVEMGRREDISEGVVICANNKLISILPVRSQVFMELFSNSPFQCKKLLFVGMIPLFGLVYGSTSISHWMVPTIILFLGENGSKAFPRGIRLQQERLLESGKANTGAFTHFSLRMLKASRALGDNSTDSDFLSLLTPLIWSYKGAAMCANPLMKCL